MKKFYYSSLIIYIYIYTILIKENIVIMDVLSLNHIKSTDYKTTTKDKIILICFDPNNETEGLNKQLDQIIDCVIVHTELKSCVDFIQSIKK